MPDFDWRSPEAYSKLQNADPTGLAWEYLRGIPNTGKTIARSKIPSTALQPNSGINGACLFAADPQKACYEQTVFWAPEVLPTVLSLRASSSQTSGQPIALDLTRLSPGELRQNTDGWHAVLRFGGATHRVWMKELPAAGCRKRSNCHWTRRLSSAPRLPIRSGERSAAVLPAHAVRLFSAAAPAICVGLARTGRAQ